MVETACSLPIPTCWEDHRTKSSTGKLA
ncbi:unnamed protein product [Calypogeia fissa]